MVHHVHCSQRRLLWRGLEFHVCTINKSAHTKKVWKLIVCTSYIYIYIYVEIIDCCKSDKKKQNDYIDFYSHRTNKIKTGIIIGFYLRALRICSPQYLNEEFEYFEHSFKSLKYPKCFILNARIKALKIYSSNKPSRKSSPLSPSSIYRSHYVLTHLSQPSMTN